jgi:SAM-dependent methyltransferase
VERYDEYFEYLKTRSRLALAYRRLWLYPRLARALKGRVLDVGCGIGDMLKFLRGSVGVDINPKLVDYCRSQGLEAHVMAADRLPFESESFDGVTLDNVLEHIAEPEPLLKEIDRVLRPGGRFVVGVPGTLGYSLDPDHKRFYSEAGLHERVRRAGFVHVKTLHSPFAWRFLDTRLAWYAIYGVYQKTRV